MFQAFKDVFAESTSFTPAFRSDGGTPAENLALQNIQARTRMVTAYLFAQLMPTVRKRKGGGGLLVLGSGMWIICICLTNTRLTMCVQATWMRYVIYEQHATMC